MADKEIKTTYNEKKSTVNNTEMYKVLSGLQKTFAGTGSLEGTLISSISGIASGFFAGGFGGAAIAATSALSGLLSLDANRSKYRAKAKEYERKIPAILAAYDYDIKNAAFNAIKQEADRKLRMSKRNVSSYTGSPLELAIDNEIALETKLKKEAERAQAQAHDLSNAASELRSQADRKIFGVF